MDFSHYTDQPVDLAVALANSGAGDQDALRNHATAVEFLDNHSNLWDGSARPLRRSELSQIRELRNSLRETVLSDDESSAAGQVNEILDRYGAVPRVSIHNGTPHLHFEPTGATMPEWLATITAMGLAAVIVEHGVDRFGLCAADVCDEVYVDTSRNRSRRHCSSTCSSREAVAAFRKRQTQEIPVITVD